MTTRFLPPQFQFPDFRFVLVPPGEKSTHIEWSKPENLLRYDDPQLAEHLAKWGNVAIHLGASGLAAVDDDSEDGSITTFCLRELPTTLMLSTWRGRKKFLYRLTGTLPTVTNLKGGEILAGQHLAIIPPSRHKDRPYDVYNNKKISEIRAEHLLAMLKPIMPEEKPMPEPVSYKGGKGLIPISTAIDLSKLKRTGPHTFQGSNPWHGSTNHNNFKVDVEHNSWYCFRCRSSGGTQEAAAINQGRLKCHESGRKPLLEHQIREYELDLKLTARRGETYGTD